MRGVGQAGLYFERDFDLGADNAGEVLDDFPGDLAGGAVAKRKLRWWQFSLTALFVLVTALLRLSAWGSS